MARTMFSIALASVLYSTAAKAAADSLCYTRDGQVDVEGQPCDPSAETSHCCHGEDHICLSNNLCYDATNNHVSEISCTDQTWSSSNCSSYCANSTTAFWRWGDLRQCDGQNSQWICGNNVSDCSNSFTVLPGYVLDRRLTTLQAIETLPAAYTRNGEETPTSVSVLIVTATASDSGGLGASGISAASADGACDQKTVGLGVGLGVGLPLLIALLTALFFLFRAQKKIRQLEQQADDPMHARIWQQQAWTKRKIRSEADGSRIYEAPGQDQR